MENHDSGRWLVHDLPPTTNRQNSPRVVVMRPVDNVCDVAILAAGWFLDLDLGDPHHLRLQ
jgi:hypothetical protein